MYDNSKLCQKDNGADDKMTEKLTLKELLKFLTKYTNWKLEQNHGEIQLTFKRNQVKTIKWKQRKVLNKPKKVGFSVGKPRKPKHHQNHVSQRWDSLDSLEWDDYDVKKSPPSVEKKPNMDYYFSEQWSLSFTDDFELDNDKLLDDESHDAIIQSDNLVQGKILLQEMKDLREEIKKASDISTLDLKLKGQNQSVPKIAIKEATENMGVVQEASELKAEVILSRQIESQPKSIFETVTTFLNPNSEGLDSSKKLNFREFLEWEIGFCDNQEQFQKLILKKDQIEHNIMKKLLSNKHHNENNYKNLHRSILLL